MGSQAPGSAADLLDQNTRAAIVTTTIASAAGGTYTVTVLRASGDTVFKRTYPFTGVRIPKAKVDSAMATIVGRGRSAEAMDQLKAKAAPLVPQIYAPVTDAVLGEDETVWLRVYSADASARYLMLDGRGGVIGEVALPRGTTVVRATRTQIWALAKDADDLQSIVRYRVAAAR